MPSAFTDFSHSRTIVWGLFTRASCISLVAFADEADRWTVAPGVIYVYVCISASFRPPVRIIFFFDCLLVLLHRLRLFVSLLN